MNTTTAQPQITEEDIRRFLVSTLLRVSPDARTGMILVMYNAPGGGLTPTFDISFSGHGMAMTTALTVDQLAVEVANNSPAALRLKRREQLLAELAQLDASQAKEIQS